MLGLEREIRMVFVWCRSSEVVVSLSRSSGEECIERRRQGEERASSLVVSGRKSSVEGRLKRAVFHEGRVRLGIGSSTPEAPGSIPSTGGGVSVSS